VLSVERASPAAEAGLREGDIIVGFSDKPVSTIDELHRILTDEKIDTRSRLAILRDSEEITVEVIPRERGAPRTD
jgi:S1-C subfamily serine protease